MSQLAELHSGSYWHQGINRTIILLADKDLLSRGVVVEGQPQVRLQVIETIQGGIMPIRRNYCLDMSQTPSGPLITFTVSPEHESWPQLQYYPEGYRTKQWHPRLAAADESVQPEENIAGLTKALATIGVSLSQQPDSQLHVQLGDCLLRMGGREFEPVTVRIPNGRGGLMNLQQQYVGLTLIPDPLKQLCRHEEIGRGSVANVDALLIETITRYSGKVVVLSA